MKEEIVYPSLESLPITGKPTAPSWLLENIAELSKSTRTLHLLFVTFLLYSGITVLSSTDRKIIFG